MSASEQSAPSAGFRFTETMSGPISAGADDYRRAAAAGRRAGERFRFTLTIIIDDLAAFRRDPEHTAAMTGEIESARFGGRRLVERGVFNLFARDERGRRQMRYQLWFRGDDDTRYRLDGFKDVHNDYMLDVWADTTTLFTRIHREDEAGDPIVASGVLHIRPLDLIPQVCSMRALGARGPREIAGAFLGFGRFFAAELCAEYGRVGKREAGRSGQRSKTP